MSVNQPRVALITGGNSGIGFATARKLAAQGFHVILASRNQQTSAQAIARIRADQPNASRLSASTANRHTGCPLKTFGHDRAEHTMNEAETRAEYIDPLLKAAGGGVVEGSRILREYPLTLGRIEGGGRRGKSLTADYVLVYRNRKLGVIEAKAWDQPLTNDLS